MMSLYRRDLLGFACLTLTSCAGVDEATFSPVTVDTRKPDSSLPLGPPVAPQPDAGVVDASAAPLGGGQSATPVQSGVDSGVCAVKVIDAYGAVPDVLIVLDRSSSMLATRWEPSRQAVKTITRDFEGLIAFGLEYFPGVDGDLGGLGGVAGGLGAIGGAGGIGGFGGLLGGGGQGGIDPTQLQCGGTEKLDVPLMLRNAAAIAASVDATGPLGLTPTGAALDTALQILGDRSPQLDATVKPAYVLLVTDGDPRCDPRNADVAQQRAARAAVQALKSANIPTYVIGYQIDPLFVGLMNELAQLGGTLRYHPVESGAQIEAALREITKDVVSCKFSLDTEPPDVKRVRVQIDGVSIPLNSPDGWVIQGKNITLIGGACATLKDGKGHILNAQIECTEVVLN